LGFGGLFGGPAKRSQSNNEKMPRGGQIKFTGDKKTAGRRECWGKKKKRTETWYPATRRPPHVGGTRRHQPKRRRWSDGNSLRCRLGPQKKKKKKTKQKQKAMGHISWTSKKWCQGPAPINTREKDSRKNKLKKPLRKRGENEDKNKLPVVKGKTIDISR